MHCDGVKSNLLCVMCFKIISWIMVLHWSGGIFTTMNPIIMLQNKYIRIHFFKSPRVESGTFYRFPLTSLNIYKVLSGFMRVHNAFQTIQKNKQCLKHVHA